MHIIPLQLDHVELLAQALYAEWHDFAPWSSLQKIRAYYAECLNSSSLPIAFAAIDKYHHLLGSAALKRYDMSERMQYEFWLGDVFVLPEARGCGVANALITYSLQAAHAMHLPDLYLYTPDVQSIYRKHGWREIETCFHNGETVSIMHLHLSKK